MFKDLFKFGWVAFAAIPTAALADCGVTHTLQEGDSLLSVAEQYYGDRSRWSVIYYANEDALAGKLVNVPVGVNLDIPCADEPQRAAKPTEPLQQRDPGIRLLTGAHYAPFTDFSGKDLSGQGLAAELVNAAFKDGPSPVPLWLTWEAADADHPFTRLDNKEFDMGFPWRKPDCDLDPSNELCVNFHFSEPFFNVPIRVYVQDGSSIEFNEDADLLGKTLCRPKSYFTYDLDRADREWLKKDLVKLVQTDNPQACFDLLLDGKVDAVTINEFLGYQTIKDMGLAGQVTTLERSISTETLHVIISKRHWRGTTHLYRFNAGLEKLKNTQRYDDIVARHLEIFRDE